MKRMRKGILLTGILCAIGMAVCACSGADTESANRAGTKAVPQETDRAALENDGESVNAADELTGSEEQSGTDGVESNMQNTGNISGTWTDSAPDLEGVVKDMQPGKITVTEAVVEETDGGESMAVPAEGEDDSEFNKVTVTYDDTTLFAVQTIYDGGARFEVTEAESSALALGQDIEVWGDLSNGELRAARICIVILAM